MSPTPVQGESTSEVPGAITGFHRAGRFNTSKLAWHRLFHATSYLTSALWTVPLIAIVIEPILQGLGGPPGVNVAGRR